MVSVQRTEKVSPVTGAGSPSRTDERFAIHATDLGILWDAGDKVAVLFGDTYGAGWGGQGAGPPQADWRCNALAFSTARDLSGGMTLDTVVARRDGGAAEVITREPGEHTIIPTSGIALNGRHYAHYMSVLEWQGPGRWATGHSGIAVSEDGVNWSRPAGSRWPNTKNLGHQFQVCSFAVDGDTVYLLGTPNGRFGDAHLARVSAEQILDPSAYRYLAGDEWVTDALSARPVFRGPVGEPAVVYHRYLGRWLVLHLDEHKAAVVMRTAERLEGPWSEPQVVAAGREFPALYGGYPHPWSLDGPELYWCMSQWHPYNVFLMRTTLAA